MAWARRSRWLSYLPIYLGPIRCSLPAAVLRGPVRWPTAERHLDLRSACRPLRPVAADRGRGHADRADRRHSLHRPAIESDLDEHRGAVGRRARAERGLVSRIARLLVALMLALFSSLFGARQVDATEHHPGMVLAVDAESLVKLRGVVVCGGVRAARSSTASSRCSKTARQMPSGVDHSISFVTQTLLSLTAIFCLPRQFQIGVVECADVEDVRHARWWFSMYLALISLVVVPIAAAAIAARAGVRSIARFVRAVVAAQRGTRLAGAARVSRRLFGRDRHGHRRDRRVGHHGQQRSGAAGDMALAAA